MGFPLRWLLQSWVGYPSRTTVSRHRASMQTSHMIGPTTRPFSPPTEEPCLSSTIYARNDTPRSPYARCTRSLTAILIGNIPSSPDYHTAALSGFNAPAAPASPPKAQLRSSPPPRSARLDFTIPPRSSCLALPDAGPLQPPVGLLAACGALYLASHRVGP